MADDKTRRRPQDASRISLSEEYEVEYWTGRFGVDRARLEEAVRNAGNSAQAVEQYLKR